MSVSYLRPVERLPGPPIGPVANATSIGRLAGLVPIVRERLDVDSALPDEAILASLEAIAARSSPWDRWRAAFESNLGHWLALKGSDLNAALSALVASLPNRQL
jgi:hypothetical protein